MRWLRVHLSGALSGMAAAGGGGDGSGGGAATMLTATVVARTLTAIER